MSLTDEIVNSRGMKLYSRTIGGILILFAAFFAWLAFPCLRWSVDQVIRMAQNDFSFQGHTFKGTYFPALDLQNLAEGTILALLSLSCLIGGCGLVRLRPWARRWGIAYMIVIAIYSSWVIATEVHKGRDFEYIFLFLIVLILPLMPLLLASAPQQQIAPLNERPEGPRIAKA